MQPVRTDDTRQILDALASHPDVAEAAVLPDADPLGGPLLVVVPKDFLTGLEVWRMLADAFGRPPGIAAVAVAPQLWRRADGEVDGTRLRAHLDRAGSTYRFAEPAGETERALAGIWQEVLGCPQVGALDDFIEAGGDSVSAVDVIAAIDAAFDTELSLDELFEAGSVRALAGVIRTGTVRKSGSGC